MCGQLYHFYSDFIVAVLCWDTVNSICWNDYDVTCKVQLLLFNCDLNKQYSDDFYMGNKYYMKHVF